MRVDGAQPNPNLSLAGRIGMLLRVDDEFGDQHAGRNRAIGVNLDRIGVERELCPTLLNGSPQVVDQGFQIQLERYRSNVVRRIEVAVDPGDRLDTCLCVAQSRAHLWALRPGGVQSQQRGNNRQAVAAAMIDFTDQEGPFLRQGFEAIARDPDLRFGRLFASPRRRRRNRRAESMQQERPEVAAHVLDDVVGGSSPERRHRDGRLRRGREIDHGGRLGQLPDRGENVQPVLVGQMMIENDDLDTAFRDASEPARGAGGDRDLVTVTLELFPEQPR
jgi:hypothetical protein